MRAARWPAPRTALAPCLRLLALCLLAQGSAVWAQAAVAAWDGQAELQQLDALRASKEADLDTEEAACYQRFVVSSCVKDVQVRRRAAVAQLRRQEASVHERQFAQQAAQQQRRSDDKLQEWEQRQADAHAQAASLGNDDRLRAQQEKQRAHAASIGQPAPASAQHAQSPSAMPPAGSASAADPISASQAAQAAHRADYARKQAEAEKRRQEIAKRLAEKNPRVAPLPVPE